MESIRVFAGTGGKQFAEAMCAALDVPLSDSKLQRFANDCLEVQLLDNVRERDVFLVQPIVAPTQENLLVAATDQEKLEAHLRGFDVIWPYRTDEWIREVLTKLVSDPACLARAEQYFLIKTPAGTFDCVLKTS